MGKAVQQFSLSLSKDASQRKIGEECLYELSFVET